MAATNAELHLLGQISGASGFPLTTLFCKYTIEAGSNFRVLQGTVQGQTQCDKPNVSCHRPNASHTLSATQRVPAATTRRRRMR